ncbi:ABC transporter ATP-binding protein [Candidatus Viridilinea mediisalina]|uniref:Heme ABC transporter ATP-binding protein n=1 Tax=Candidatus Viridilinea mediisalina TaxID=2024553 RepID=A0A2A6RFK3_9CHLR|nr:ABC transporter ATP-binding protein [Candidatus Viridilinea mediisalina]PDW01666.1 heme ABC transporter ATP-binding protein [Candidatus Viridilinea mediisalina]
MTQEGTERPVVLEARQITKRFPGVTANDQVSLRLHKGEVLALLGENGAGKSTLMNILYGLYSQDAGEILVDGQPFRAKSPHDAIARGIGMVHQHFQLVPVMSVVENVMLGNEITRWGFLSRRKVAEHILEISRRYGLPVEPYALVADLDVGAQQRVEIIKALYRNADILILDEPTAVLTPQEADDLVRVMRTLTAQGKALIFITHKLREVLEVADRIVVLRAGRVVGETTPREASEASLAAMMVGRSVLLRVEKAEAKPGATVLSVRDLQVRDDRRLMVVDGVSLEVHAGEILGIAGVQGNGQTELVQALTGLRASEAGSIEIAGNNVTSANPRQISELGVAHIPEDRQRDGIVTSYPLTENGVLELYYRPPFARGIVRNEGAIVQHAKQLVADFDVRTPSVHVEASSLSGGNQQKFIVAREFSRDLKLLIAAQPTRGIDVGSIEFIHQQIIKKRDEGVAVLLVSAELDEILALSDLIAVMYHGHIVATVRNGELTREQLGLLMAGGGE